MKNKYLYKKLKYELALSYLYNKNKGYKIWRQIAWNLCECFNVEFTNQRYSVIHNFSYALDRKICIDIPYLCYTDKMFIDYANAHNLKLYDVKECKFVNSV